MIWSLDPAAASQADEKALAHEYSTNWGEAEGAGH